MRRRFVRSTIALGTAALAVPVLAQGASAATAPAFKPVVLVAGLNNPRQLSLSADGYSLLVAEAGAGDPTGKACSTGPEGPSCVGTTGSVSLVLGPSYRHDTKPLRVVKGLLSGAGPDGSGAVGSDGVGARDFGHIFVAETYAPPESFPKGIPGSQAGKLLTARVFGAPHVAADLAAYEKAHDPDHQGFDSNPYGVLVLRDRVLVADAAGNDVLSVDRYGHVSTFAVFPNIQTGACKGQPNDAGTTGCDYVPTALAQGRDGSIYVGGLGGLTPGAGRVTRFTAGGHWLHTWGGLTAVNGLAVSRTGTLYVSQLITAFGAQGPDFTTGRITKISGSYRRSVAVPQPAGLAVDGSGTVYASVFSLSPAGGFVPDPGAPRLPGGQVWRFRL